MWYCSLLVKYHLISILFLVFFFNFLETGLFGSPLVLIPKASRLLSKMIRIFTPRFAAFISLFIIPLSARKYIPIRISSPAFALSISLFKCSPIFASVTNCNWYLLFSSSNLVMVSPFFKLFSFLEEFSLFKSKFLSGNSPVLANLSVSFSTNLTFSFSISFTCCSISVSLLWEFFSWFSSFLLKFPKSMFLLFFSTALLEISILPFEKLATSCNPRKTSSFISPSADIAIFSWK